MRKINKIIKVKLRELNLPEDTVIIMEQRPQQTLDQEQQVFRVPKVQLEEARRN